MKKKQLILDCPEPEFEQSAFSEMGPQGIHFFRNGIRVGPEGIQGSPSLLAKQQLIFTGREIGRGSSCTVVEARSPLGLVAVKSINVLEREKRHQLMNDVSLMLSLKGNQYSCPYLIQLYGAYYDEGSVKVILELMDWGSLADLATACTSRGLRVEEPVLADIALQMLGGLAYLHTHRQAHRDIKPQNVLLDRQGRIKLTDFGISRQTGEQQLMQTFVGTYTYMSPERIEGRVYSLRGDIWSLGMVLAELALGRFPYASKSFIETASMVTNGPPPLEPLGATLQDFLRHCLSPETNRPSAVCLLGHPWLASHLASQPSLKHFLNKLN